MRPLTPELVSAFRRLDTCAVSNAVERFDVRLRNEGFADASVRCLFDGFPPVIGHAVTARIRCATPPPVGHTYIDRTDWWNYLASIPAPRIVVVEDIDDRAGLGSFVGEIHASVFQALGCVAYATNGSVRDLPAVARAGFQLFAGGVSVSHAFVHLIDFGGTVTIGGLNVNSGDVLFGDRHGLMAIPDGTAGEIPEAVAAMTAREARIIGLCKSPDFSMDKLRALVKQLQ